MENIYFFQWISDLGGADTRLKELILLFSKSKKYKLFCIPNDDFRLSEYNNVSFLKEHGVKILSWKDLPEKTSGFGISFSNFRLFSEKWRIEKIKSFKRKNYVQQAFHSFHRYRYSHLYVHQPSS